MSCAMATAPGAAECALRIIARLAGAAAARAQTSKNPPSRLAQSALTSGSLSPLTSAEASTGAKRKAQQGMVFRRTFGRSVIVVAISKSPTCGEFVRRQ